jgi:hypothetical protein
MNKIIFSALLGCSLLTGPAFAMDKEPSQAKGPATKATPVAKPNFLDANTKVEKLYTERQCIESITGAIQRLQQEAGSKQLLEHGNLLNTIIDLTAQNAYKKVLTDQKYTNSGLGELATTFMKETLKGNLNTQDSDTQKEYVSRLGKLATGIVMGKTLKDNWDIYYPAYIELAIQNPIVNNNESLMNHVTLGSEKTKIISKIVQVIHMDEAVLKALHELTIKRKK